MLTLPTNSLTHSPLESAKESVKSKVNSNSRVFPPSTKLVSPVSKLFLSQASSSGGAYLKKGTGVGAVDGELLATALGAFEASTLAFEDAAF